MDRYRRIQSAVLRLTGVRAGLLSGPSRDPLVVLSRQLIARLCRELTDLSAPRIAARMGKPRTAHSSVLILSARLGKRLRRGELLDRRYRSLQGRPLASVWAGCVHRLRRSGV